MPPQLQVTLGAYCAPLPPALEPSPLISLLCPTCIASRAATCFAFISSTSRPWVARRVATLACTAAVKASKLCLLLLRLHGLCQTLQLLLLRGQQARSLLLLPAVQLLHLQSTLLVDAQL